MKRRTPQTKKKQEERASKFMWEVNTIASQLNEEAGMSETEAVLTVVTSYLAACVGRGQLPLPSETGAFLEKKDLN